MSRIRSDTRKSGTHYERPVQTLFAHPKLYLARHIENKWAQVDGFSMNLKPARGHLREIEDLVDKMPKMIGRSLYTLDRFYLSGGKFPVNTLPQQFRREPLQLLRALNQTTRLTSLVTNYEGKAEHSCKGDDPPDETSPATEPNLRKHLH